MRTIMKKDATLIAGFRIKATAAADEASRALRSYRWFSTACGAIVAAKQGELPANSVATEAPAIVLIGLGGCHTYKKY